MAKKSKDFDGGSIIGILAAVLVVAILFSLVSCGGGAGFGTGKGAGTGDSEANSSTKTETEQQETTEQTQNSEGNTNRVIIEVSVVESEYFYKNKKISLKDFLAELESIEGDFIVVVTEDNSTLKAYNKLIDALEENAINYTEE